MTRETLRVGKLLVAAFVRQFLSQRITFALFLLRASAECSSKLVDAIASWAVQQPQASPATRAVLQHMQSGARGLHPVNDGIPADHGASRDPSAHEPGSSLAARLQAQHAEYNTAGTHDVPPLAPGSLGVSGLVGIASLAQAGLAGTIAAAAPSNLQGNASLFMVCLVSFLFFFFRGVILPPRTHCLCFWQRRGCCLCRGPRQPVFQAPDRPARPNPRTRCVKPPTMLLLGNSSSYNPHRQTLQQPALVSHIARYCLGLTIVSGHCQITTQSPTLCFASHLRAASVLPLAQVSRSTGFTPRMETCPRRLLETRR